MGNKMPKFKNDRFKKSRGGYSRWLLISCEKCKTSLFIYQKDGPGTLKRLYLDRIINRSPKIKDHRNFICKKCKTAIGILVAYKKENRPVYRLFAGAIRKKIIDGNKVKKFIRAW